MSDTEAKKIPLTEAAAAHAAIAIAKAKEVKRTKPLANIYKGHDDRLGAARYYSIEAAKKHYAAHPDELACELDIRKGGSGVSR